MASTDTHRGDTTHRQSAIARLIDDVRAARSAGRLVKDEVIVGANPELMPELQHELDKLRRVQAARAAADRVPLEQEVARALAAQTQAPEDAAPPGQISAAHKTTHQRTESNSRFEDALMRLESIDPQAAAAVRLRLHSGFSFEMIAQTLGITLPAAEGDWLFARAWLYRITRESIP